MVMVLDLTFTVGNTEIATLLGLKPDEPFAGLFGFGFFEIVFWIVQALLASLIGELLFGRKPASAA
jgi:hypothetical protein